MCKSLVTSKVSELEIKEFNGKRVVTFKDIDLVHGRVEGTAKRNFNENKKRFMQYEDFYFVKPKDIEKNEIRTAEINNFGTYLITETGYLMLVKSFADDLAWKVQRELVNTYFKIKEIVNEPTLKNEIRKINESINEMQQYYRLPHSEKLNLNKRIKSRLGSIHTKEEVEDVKEYVFMAIGIDKWEDLPLNDRLAVMDMIDRRCNIIVETRTNLFNWNKI